MSNPSWLVPERSTSSAKCNIDNMEFTVSPSGKLIGTYGKEHATPGYQSCKKTGPIIMNSGPIDGKKKSDSLGIETFDNIKFSTVIRYDAA